jgi:serine/threonine protein kinase
MDDRYEIKGKIGQGGIGAVYRAFDQRMNREVAIKRIVQDSPQGSPAEDEATRQMTKEAGALAALQHPHIVTVYDVGVDEDGPYVVMELLTGKTLDEVVTRAPMTGADFREFCLQTQEALIAAQDLGIVHRDLKPGNVMLTWLPSGKFQVKIVDFGLAKFSPKASLQTLDQTDSIYGSIFFMAPEQFERVPIDSRTDMYAIGCVYYFTLTGKNPFDGDTGPQVMASHLGHLVTPLNELRPELPKWLCEWVMWHINRQPADRPTDARQSLQVFLQNDAAPTPAPAAEPARPAAPLRPRLTIPGGGSAKTPAALTAILTAAPMTPPPVQTVPQPLLPPAGSLPSLHTTSVHLTAGETPEKSTGRVSVGGAVSEKIPSNNAVPSGPVSAGGTTLSQSSRRPANPVSAQSGTRSQKSAAQQEVAPKKKSSKKPMIAGFFFSLLLVMMVGSFLAYKFVTQAKRDAEFKMLLNSVDDPKTTEIELKNDVLERLFKSALTTGNLGERQKILKALAYGKSIEGENIDLKVIAMATAADTDPERREELFREVIAVRKNPAALPALMDFIREDGADEASLTSAIQAATPAAGDPEFTAFLSVLKSAKNEQTRVAAEQAVAGVMSRSQNRDGIKKSLKELYSTTANADLQRSLKKLIDL